MNLSIAIGLAVMLAVRAKEPVTIHKTCTVPRSFALTFDDGPYNFGRDLDATLDASNDKASFFINGNNYGCIYDYANVLIERYKKGHLIANHTWSHVYLSKGDYQQINHQLELLENAMIKILGVKPTYFRPPYGDYNDLVLQVLSDRGYKGMILWSQDSGDSLGSPPSSEDIIEEYKTYPEETIVLNHETQDFTVYKVTPAVIPILKQKGFSLKTVPQCLSLGSNPSDWYERVQKPGVQDDTWTCTGTPAPGQFS